MQQKPRLRQSRWKQWQAIRKIKALRGHQPLTGLYSPMLLHQFLDRFDSVFIKPEKKVPKHLIFLVQWVTKSHERKVIYLDESIKPLLVLHEDQQLAFSSIRSFDFWLDLYREGEQYIIQQAIERIEWEERPVDLQTILQINRQGHWEITGQFARVAQKGTMVTDPKWGGKAVRIEEYLDGIGMEMREQKEIRKKLAFLSVIAAKGLAATYRNTIYALNFGLDRDKKLWLMGLNTKPDIQILRSVDQKMFLRANSLQKKRGRKKQKNSLDEGISEQKAADKPKNK
ncbi:YheC/YheD family protein [Brevibacillus massiliensis]|uniref:YheC/YheD family protein n=1 Tax=Brevibacillus massiliensis TaxID=1118054 RepID=UPI00137584BE|nr:YheC/YheD family protein [Brevibacillus massiliensis]